MAKLDHTYDAVADTYAKTLLGLSESAGNSDEVFGQLSDFTALMESDDVFGDFVVNPAVDADRRRAVFEKLFRGKLIDLLLDTLQVVNQKGRCQIIPLICERYRLALEEARDEVDVWVTSAVELSRKLRHKVEEAATQMAGKTARLIEKVDPDLLGGLVVQIGDRKIDASVSARLHRMREALIERASREIHGGKDYFDVGEPAA